MSCTEQGRWSYTSSYFADSGVVMGSNVSREKVSSVHYNLENAKAFRSDQGAAWDSMHGRSKTCSTVYGPCRTVQEQGPLPLANDGFIFPEGGPPCAGPRFKLSGVGSDGWRDGHGDLLQNVQLPGWYRVGGDPEKPACILQDGHAWDGENLRKVARKLLNDTWNA